MERSVAIKLKRATRSQRLLLWERRTVLFIVDILLLMIMLFKYHRHEHADLTLRNFLIDDIVGILYGLLLFGFLTATFKLYDLDHINKTRRVLPLAFFISLLFGGLYVLTPVLTPFLPANRMPIFVFVFGFTLLFCSWRVLFATIIHNNVFEKKFLLLTNDQHDQTYLNKLKRSIEGNEYDMGLKIVRTYSLSPEKEEQQRLRQALIRSAKIGAIDQVIVLDEDEAAIYSSLSPVLVQLMQYGVTTLSYFRLYEEIREAVPLQFGINQLPTSLAVSRYNSNYAYQLWHRLVNIIASIWGLGLMICLIPIILILNLFFNKGPLFYYQYRIGKGGKKIRLIKFRSMVVGAEKEGALMTSKDDSRITRFGKILRKFRIDELPQFIAVLKGDMSLIGPRPERKVFIDQLVRKFPMYDTRHIIRPGITGWAQVKYDYGDTETDSLRKLEYDLYYIKNRSITLDLRIIVKTIYTILLFKGR